MSIPEAVRRDLEWDCVRLHLDRMLACGLVRLEREPKPGGPRELHIELTHRCNLKCVMCEHWELEHRDPDSVKREMDFEKIRRLVEGSRTLAGIESIAVTGGEPWLRADFVDIVSFLAERFPKAGIIVLSNFWNTGHIRLKMSEFRARGVTRLRLGSSLDGLESAHDRIRGEKGAFRGLVETSRMLKTEFPEASFGFTFTLTPHNAHELYDTFRFVREELGCALGAQWAIDRPGVAPLPWTPESRDEGLGQIREILRDLCRRYDAAGRITGPDKMEHSWLWSELMYWRYLEEYGRDPKRFAFFKRCGAGERHVMLDPEGGVFYCPVNKDRPIGNALEGPLDALWSSPKADSERRYVESCRCHCWLRCMSAPVLDQLVRLSSL
jgi:MoaA/NifB/PqqE/SkfB family radical SAM enzyme